MEYKAFYCPTENLPRSFKRVDEKMALVGAKYQCENNSCRFIGREYELYSNGHDLDSDGFIKAIGESVRRIKDGR